MTGDEWENVARFLLRHTVNFVDSELVKTDEDKKEFDLALRILAEEGSVDGEGRKQIADAYEKPAKDRDVFYQQQGNMEDKIEARDGIIVGLREQLVDSLDSHVCGEGSVQLQEKLKAAGRKAEEAEEKAGEKRNAWVEKEA